MDYRKRLEEAALREPYSFLGINRSSGRAVVVENSTGRYFEGDPKNWRDSLRWTPTGIREEAAVPNPRKPVRHG